MVRKLPLAAAIALAIATNGANALGLGDIKTRSALNQRFDADISLLSVSPAEIDGVKVKLASPAAFARAGVERPFLLSKLRFKPMVLPDGSTIIRVSSRRTIPEPFLDFLIEVNWPQGRLVREYTVLLDPPLTTGRKAPKVKPASAGAAQAASTSAYAGSATSYRVGPGETLWNIAKRHQYAGVTVQQMMMAMLNASPDAFINNNINNLKAGAVLRIPSRDDVIAFNQAEARRIAAEQYEQWQGKQTASSSAAAGQPAPKPMPVSPGAPSKAAKAEDEAHLKLVGGRAEETVTSGASRTAGEQVAPGELQQELIAAQEDIAASRFQSEELAKRMELLEQQLADMKRLLTLKDEELARLQAGGSAQSADGMAASTTEQPLAKPMVEPAPPMPEPGMQPAEPAPMAPAEAEQPALQPDAAVPPQPEPEVAPAAEPAAGLMDQLRGNATLIGGAIAALLVLLALIWAAVSRRKSEPQPDKTVATAAPVAAGAAAATATDAAAAPSTDEDEQLLAASTEEADDTSFLSEFSASDMNALQDETGEVDPISEADVYIAYGRYQQAEDLVRQALEKEPERMALKHKLLEIYYANRATDSFNRLASEMADAGAGGQDAEAWNRALLMGQELDPDNDLYADAVDAPSVDLTDDLDAALSELESQLTEDADSPLAGGLSNEQADDGLDDSLEELDLSGLAGEPQPADAAEDDDALTLDLDSQLAAPSGDLPVEDDALSLSPVELAASDESAASAPAAGQATAEPEAPLADDTLPETQEPDADELSLDMSDLESGLEEAYSEEILSLDNSVLELPDADSVEISLPDEEPAGEDDQKLAASAEELAAELEQIGGVEDFGIDGAEAPELKLDDSLEEEGPDVSSIQLADQDDEIVSSFMTDELDDGDDVETKLDLARAYVEMGDAEGAQSILGEVVQEGSDQQKQEAEALLKQLDA